MRSGAWHALIEAKSLYSRKSGRRFFLVVSCAIDLCDKYYSRMLNICIAFAWRWANDPHPPCVTTATVRLCTTPSLSPFDGVLIGPRAHEYFLIVHLFCARDGISGSTMPPSPGATKAVYAQRITVLCEGAILRGFRGLRRENFWMSHWRAFNQATKFMVYYALEGF